MLYGSADGVGPGGAVRALRDGLEEMGARSGPWLGAGAGCIVRRAAVAAPVVGDGWEAGLQRPPQRFQLPGAGVLGEVLVGQVAVLAAVGH